MISKEQYILLYEKFLQGQCTPEEIALLDAYQDEINLNGENVSAKEVDENAVQHRLWQRLQNHIDVASEPTLQKTSGYLWLKIAAVLLVVISFGLLLFNYTRVNKPQNQFGSVKGGAAQIKAGGNNAYLTLADGTVISLNGAGDGELANRSGIQITKAKDGMLVYKFVNTKGTKPATNEINTITTPRGGQYQVQLADGTKVWLNAETSIKFPVTFNTKHRDVELTGEAYFEVAKNKHQPFTVHANDTKVQVLGTHFNVSAYDRDAVSTTLLEGSVRLVKQNATAMLKPGQNGTTEQNRQDINVQKADIEQDIAWKNGYIIFNDADIKTVMKQAARWYNVDVEYQGSLSDQRYNGKISKYKDITELLTNMELTGTVHFKIEGRRIIVMK
ncbi:FecR domain-containing protein [Mucilaginibacter sp. CSA2-8R]|uniref:FecR family protein n=1 Tax=Mucilaginibacter sp. CSA2-8R TaxID=3141542 RepID=UPI00315CCFCA